MRKEELYDGHSHDLLIELHYFPCLSYFGCLTKFESICLEACEYFQKQSYRNRCYIRIANKVISLSVPVVKSNRKQWIRDVRIDYSQGWLKDHWRTIASAYGKAPFFEEYGPYIEKVLFGKHLYLFDLNQEILTICLRLLGLPRQVGMTTTYEEPKKTLKADFRDLLHPKKTELASKLYKPVPYRQNFGNDFIPDLSILDLLFCQGNNSLSIIRQSTK